MYDQEPADAQLQQEQPAEEQQEHDIFSVDLVARKAGLRVQLAAFTKVPQDCMHVLHTLRLSARFANDFVMFVKA